MSISRRYFVLGGVGALSAAVLGDAFLIEPTAIDVSRHVVAVPGLPPGLEGMRIACLTDVHLGGGVSPAARAALEVLARERPEVVVFIGDICNEQDDLPVLAGWARQTTRTSCPRATRREDCSQSIRVPPPSAGEVETSDTMRTRSFALTGRSPEPIREPDHATL